MKSEVDTWEKENVHLFILQNIIMESTHKMIETHLPLKWRSGKARRGVRRKSI